jgi:hypothetical protein
MPIASYAPFYVPFWTQHRILHILVAISLENKRTTYKDLVDNLKKMDSLNKSVTTARLILGRDLRKIDIENDDVVGLTITIVISSMVSDLLALLESIYFGDSTRPLRTEWDPNFTCSSNSRTFWSSAL